MNKESYEKLSIRELKEILDYIDKSAYPEKYAVILEIYQNKTVQAGKDNEKSTVSIALGGEDSSINSNWLLSLQLIIGLCLHLIKIGEKVSSFEFSIGGLLAVSLLAIASLVALLYGHFKGEAIGVYSRPRASENVLHFSIIQVFYCYIFFLFMRVIVSMLS